MYLKKRLGVVVPTVGQSVLRQAKRGFNIRTMCRQFIFLEA